MNCHFNITFLANGNDFFEEMPEISPHILMRDVFIFSEQLLDLAHALRFPARHRIAVGVTVDLPEHILHVQTDQTT